MKSSSSSSCFLFLLVSAASIWNISAQYPHHQLGANNANVMTKMNVVSTEKGDVNEEVVSPSTATNIKADKRSIGGRRMAVGHQVTGRLEKEVKVSVASGRGRSSSSSKPEATKSSFNGSSSHESDNNINDVECRDESRFNPEKEGDGDGHEEYAGFVAFSQDYHSPRHHPPKNNR